MAIASRHAHVVLVFLFYMFKICKQTVVVGPMPSFGVAPLAFRKIFHLSVLCNCLSREWVLLCEIVLEEMRRHGFTPIGYGVMSQ